MVRLGEQPGTVALDVAFNPDDKRLDLNLKASEPAGGLIATALNIPGLPPASEHDAQQHAPHLGENGADILAELGYGAAEVDAIFARGGVKPPVAMAKAAE